MTSIQITLLVIVNCFIFSSTLLFATFDCIVLVKDPSLQRKCRHEWQQLGNTCFMFSAEKDTWANAQINCAAFNANLAEIHNAETNTFLKNHLKILHFTDHSVSYWIGLTDIAKANTWEWLHSRTLVNYSDWHPGQPEINDQHCAIMHGPTAFDWHDYWCSAMLFYICQEDLN